MIRHVVPLAAVALAAACTSKPKVADDVLSGTRGTTVARTTQCTQGNPDGVRCDVKTCAKDSVSDCAIFRDRCKASGHDYDGNNDSGTCTRREEIG